MSAWPSCTSVKVSGVTSLHTWRASATVCRTCSRSSCHGNRRILGSTGAVGGLGLARGVASAPAGCPRCTEGAGVQDAGPVCSEGAHRFLRHVGAPSCGLCALRYLRGSALGGKDPGAPRPPPDLTVPLTVGRPWAPGPAPPGSPGSPPRTLLGPPGVPAAMTWATTPVFTPLPTPPHCRICKSQHQGPRPPEPSAGLPWRVPPCADPECGARSEPGVGSTSLPQRRGRVCLIESPRAWPAAWCQQRLCG